MEGLEGPEAVVEGMTEEEPRFIPLHIDNRIRVGFPENRPFLSVNGTQVFQGFLRGRKSLNFRGEPFRIGVMLDFDHPRHSVASQQFFGHGFVACPCIHGLDFIMPTIDGFEDPFVRGWNGRRSSRPSRWRVEEAWEP